MDYKVCPEKDGSWSVMIRTNKADFVPYKIEFSQEGNSTVVNDVLLGEVWLCSGQSNMQMKMKGYYGSPVKVGREAIADSRNYKVHVFDVPRVASAELESDCKGRRISSNPSTIAETSASAYFWGRQLYKALGVPCRSCGCSLWRGFYCSLYEWQFIELVSKIQIA